MREEASPGSESIPERERFPRFYDLVQRALGSDRSLRQVEERLRALAPRSVLDVGAGTGLYAAAVPAGARYVASDLDPAKLQRLRGKVPGAEVVVADARELPFGDHSFDVAILVAVAHHLDDEGVDAALAELARVSGHAVFLEPLASDRALARALWRLDRGSHPRGPEDLLARAEPHFELEHVERYSIRHDYLLWVGASRLPAVP
jgi:ubiquinone/menaquinone biosynthesis C-methylase UbiE